MDDDDNDFSNDDDFDDSNDSNDWIDWIERNYDNNTVDDSSPSDGNEPKFNKLVSFLIILIFLIISMRHHSL